MIKPAFIIAGKRVFVVADHAHAIKAWALVRRELSTAPALITLDHHSDTRPGFNHAIHVDKRAPANPMDMSKVVKEYCEELDVRDEARFERAVYRLVNDEHIDAATTAGIIDHAYVISYQSGATAERKTHPNYSEISKAVHANPLIEYDQIPFTPYDLPYNRIFELKQTCFPGCPKVSHDDDCTRPHYDHAIESSFLNPKLATIREMARSLGIQDILESPFILDIDLDYFHTAKSIAPEDAATFELFVQRAHAVTIATEAQHVEWNKLDGEPVTSETLLRSLLGHITVALTGTRGSVASAE